MDISGFILLHCHHHYRTPPHLPLHSRVPLIHDPQGCLQQTVMGLCQVVAAPASAPARPRPRPGTALICSHSSSRQSVKHWGKIFCLPEQLLINCPFIDVQDKFCLLSLPPFYPLLVTTSPSLSCYTFFSPCPCSCTLELPLSQFLCSLWFSETGTLTLPLNKLQGCQGRSSVGQSPLQRGDGEGERQRQQGRINKVEGKDKKQ